MVQLRVEIRLKTMDLGGLVSRARGAVLPALVEEAEAILAASRPLVPIYRGPALPGAPGPNDLLDSGQVQVVAEGERPQVMVRYGGPAAPHALVVHEVSVPGHVGQTKYLERPFLLALPGMAERIAARIRKSLGLQP